jgi:hypothetical protein
MRVKQFLLAGLTLLATGAGAGASFLVFNLPAQQQDKVLARTAEKSPVVKDSVGDASTGNYPVAGMAGIDSLINPVKPSYSNARSTILEWLVMAGLLVATALISYYFYQDLPHISRELRKDLDPPQLRALLTVYAEDIERLGNPRKIKRLSNKIRFQYYYLAGKGLNDLQQLVNVLVQLEGGEARYGLEGMAFILSEEGFGEFFRRDFGVVADERFIRLVHALNRDSVFC